MRDQNGPGPPTHWVARVGWAALAAYAAYLTVEIALAGGWQSSEAASSLGVILVFLLPAAGLAWFGSSSRGWLSTFTVAILLLSTAGIVVLSYYALHLAPPDGQNALVIPVAAFGQLLLLLLIGAAALILRLYRRR